MSPGKRTSWAAESVIASIATPIFRGLPVAVIGSGSAAASGALTLLFYASEVHLVLEKLEVSERLADQIRASSIVLHRGPR